MNDVFEQIKRRKWFLGIRREESLFFYSAKFMDREKFTLKNYKNNFVESIIFPQKDNEVIRAFNLDQSKLFHQESKKKVLRNPELLRKYIDHDDKLWKKISKLSERLEKFIEKRDLKKAKKCFQDILEKYGEHGAYFLFIFSMGMMLEENKKEIENAGQVLEAHNKWRNEIAFKEEKMGENLFDFFEFLKKEKKSDAKEKDLMTFLTAQEIVNLADGALDGQEAAEKTEHRKQSGYVYLYLRDKRYQDTVLDDPILIGQIKEYFGKLSAPKEAGIKGQVAFNSGENIKGEVVVVKDKRELEKADLAGKILVTIQTTPHFIPYLKNVKAIITDEGGITCHAAIVSREMKKPCVIGTKIATQVLKTGDEVEVDATHGKVTIIKKS
ncbi:MAG TPA: PEP-utilizing enzyme [Candidatus Bipolaricaulota bacterium]|nr:PEP-utilizing enzyme [Candidatus Bipolaricaulota bacterium]